MKLMNSLTLTALLVGVTTFFAANARAAPLAEKLKVVTTLPDLADIAREIGGDRVDVTSLYKGRENTHALTGKPSHLIAMSKADVFVQVGLSLETSFVPGLLENCRNDKIQPGKPGFVNGSEGWSALDVPTNLSRKEGDVHPQGNPHMNLDPRAGQAFADKIHEHLCLVDPSSKALYDARFADYSKRLAAAAERWAAMGKAWSGKKIVVYHKEYDYLASTYGLAIQGSIESKPGIPPTPNHVAELVDTMKRDKGAAILTAVWSNNDTVAQIAKDTGAKIVELPNMCGGSKETETWIGMMDLVHQRLQEAFGTQTPAR